MKREGFTIVELLIYMAVAAVAIVVLTSFMVDVTKHAANTKSKKNVEENARLIMGRLVEKIRNAQSITAVSPSTNSKTLQLTTQSGAAVQYQWNDTNFTADYNDGAGFVPLSTDKVRITRLYFSNKTTNPSVNPNEVTIDLEVQQKNTTAPTGQQYTVHFITTVVRRQSVY